MPSIFSRIIAGEIPGSIVFEEPEWVGLLDISPISPGHLLIVPRYEVALMEELPARVLADFGPLLGRAMRAVRAAMDCPAVSVLIRDGVEAGQEVPHVHVHIVPRLAGAAPHDFRGGSYGDDRETAAEEMMRTAARLKTVWDGTAAGDA